MKRDTYHLELITPCFCAGADQATAEIRVPTIRGQLRWWYRALGGTRENEALIFGATSGDSGSGSSIRVSIANVKHGAKWQPPGYQPMAEVGYVWHFAKASGKNPGSNEGPRWTSSGALAAGTTFQLHITWLREFPALKSEFDQAVLSFLTFGCLGLRATRGLGAFHCPESGVLDERIGYLETKNFTVKRRISADFDSINNTLRDWASWLKNCLRKDYPAKSASPLGSAKPRQASSVHFRPIRVGANTFTWLAFEPPARRILTLESDLGDALLSKYNFEGPAPAVGQR